MINKVKELLLERYEVISRSADDCTYILADARNLSKEELENKLYTRFDRINSEMQVLDGYMKAWFKNTESYQLESSDDKVAKDDNVFTLDDIEEYRRGEVVVLCKSEYLKREFLDQLAKNMFILPRIEYYKDICFRCANNFIYHGHVDYYGKNGYKIKEFKGW